MWRTLSSRVDLRRRRSLRVAEGVRVERLVVLGLALDRLGVRVEQELARVAAVAVRGVVGSVDAEAVALPGLHVGHVAVPHEAVRLGQVEARLVQVVVEQAELDAFGDLGEDGEVDPRAVVRRSEWVGLARPDLHGPSSVVRSRQCRGATAWRPADDGGRTAHSLLPGPVERKRPYAGRRAVPRRARRGGWGRRCSAGASLLPVPHEGDLRTGHASLAHEEASTGLDRVGVAGDPRVRLPASAHPGSLLTVVTSSPEELWVGVSHTSSSRSTAGPRAGASARPRSCGHRSRHARSTASVCSPRGRAPRAIQ